MEVEQKQYLQAALKETAAGDLEFVASDETIDRHGESIPIATWNLENYLKNPVLLIDHNYMIENIVGVSQKTYVDGKQLKIQPVLHNITEKARNLAAMIADKIVKTVSVGYLPHENEDGTVTNELLEVSFVAIPANPNATMLSAKALDTAKSEIESFVKQYITLTVGDGEDDELDDDEEELEVKGPVSDEVARQQTMEQKYNNLRSAFEVLYAMADVYMQDDTPVESFTTLLIEASDMLKQVAGGEAPTQNSIKLTGKALVFSEQIAKEIIPLIVKEGRVLSKKNRELISKAVESLAGSSVVLQELLDATTAPSEGDKNVDPEPVEPADEVDTQKTVVIPRELLENLLGQMRVNDKHNELNITLVKTALKK